MPTIDEAISGAAAPEENAQQEAEVIQPRVGIPEWMKAKTGGGAVTEYLDHPMNFNKSPHLAKIIRGLSGIMGSLDYALVDIVMGLMGFMKERKKEGVAIHAGSGIAS